MSASFIRLPDDAANTGKKVRTEQMTVGADTVHGTYVLVCKSDGTVLDPVAGIGLPVAGDVANHAADSGAPVKAGAVYNAAAPTYDDGDRTSLQADVNGNLKVNVVAGVSGGTSMTDDAAFTAGTTVFTPVGGTYRSTLDTLDDNDGGACHVTQYRGLHVNLRSAAGVEQGTTAAPVNVAQVDGQKATYSAMVKALSLAAAGNIALELFGSASKTVRITRLSLFVTADAAVLLTPQLTKHSAVNTGGTSTSPAKVPHDSASAAATATCKAYTVDPTPGTEVGTVRAATVLAGPAADAKQVDRVDWNFGDGPGQGIVLRGTAQGVSLTFGAVTGTNGKLTAVVEWTEE